MTWLVAIAIGLGMLASACGREGGGLAGEWTTGSLVLTLSEGGAFSFTEPRGASSGTYGTVEFDGSLRFDAAESDIPNFEFADGCTGTVSYSYDLDGDRLTLTDRLGTCELSWPVTLELSRS